MIVAGLMPVSNGLTRAQTERNVARRRRAPISPVAIDKLRSHFATTYANDRDVVGMNVIKGRVAGFDIYVQYPQRFICECDWVTGFKMNRHLSVRCEQTEREASGL